MRINRTSSYFGVSSRPGCMDGRVDGWLGGWICGKTGERAIIIGCACTYSTWIRICLSVEKTIQIDPIPF